MQQALATRVAPTLLASLYESELVEAQRAMARNNPESLHDLRVALRRLAVLVEQLMASGSKRKAVLRAIRRLLKQSNERRDAQVMLGWLKEQWPVLSRAEHAGARAWQRKLRRQRQPQLEPEEMAAALHRLRPLLASVSPSRDAGRQPLGELVAQRLEQQSDDLASLMSNGAAIDRLHLIRLKAKTVRYLLAPFSDSLPACVRAGTALQQMQMVLGEWHDGVLRQQSLNRCLRKEIVAITGDTHAATAAASLAERAPLLPGLLALARANNQAQLRLVARVEREYLHDGGTHVSSLLQLAIPELRKAATVHG